MKNIFSILFLLSTSLLFSQGDYQVEINGKVIEIELDKEYEVKVGKEILKVSVKQKDTLLYKDDAFNFKFPKEYKVAKSNIDEGIEQLMLMTAEGSGFIIQKYTTFNPTLLNELMINEVTKESVSYGYSMVRKDYEKTLASGLRIKVIKAVLTYNDEINIYEIASVGEKDAGLLFMSMEMDDSENSLGRNLINLIWSSLEIK
ncbi:hypothetical protein [uncultured Polaribacter sp.]|uniref:hypothetical protein n=1 Tax=uncultured Polaribacter sp. TaxID=174711 RepID=UPI0030D8F75E|tara:strand:+ start:1895 stop:2500 length:606 start_codon:yes stop_codon:yes gene_type:complete